MVDNLHIILHTDNHPTRLIIIISYINIIIIIIINNKVDARNEGS